MYIYIDTFYCVFIILKIKKRSVILHLATDNETLYLFCINNKKKFYIKITDDKINFYYNFNTQKVLNKSIEMNTIEHLSRVVLKSRKKS